MATYHCSVKVISRSSGRSSVAAAAYRSGETIKNERDGITHDYSKKQGVQHSEILLPENAPEQFQDRNTLWNAVEKSEVRKDARTAREIEIALPAELNTKEQAALVRDYTQHNFVDKGMCADFSIHDAGSGNPHAHIMLTTRSVTPEGFAGKDRSWNDRQLVEEWREDWAKSYNREMGKKNLPDRVDHRSLKAQGIEREPTVHMGKAAQMERRGVRTERGDINRERKASGRELAAINGELKALAAERERAAAEPIRAEQPASLEQIAAKLQEKEKRYFDISAQIKSEKENLAEISLEIRAQEGQRQSLEHDAKNLRGMWRKSNELEAKKTEIKDEGIFHDRKAVKEIDRQLDSLNKSRDEARAKFRATWGIEPNSKIITDKAQEIAERITALQAAAVEPMQRISELQERQKAAAMDYKTEKVLADMRPDREQIAKARESRREIPARQPGRRSSIMENIRAIEERQQFNSISKAEYQAVAEHLQRTAPELAAKVMKHAQSVFDRQIERGWER